jgi:hypothetical protein
MIDTEGVVDDANDMKQKIPSCRVIKGWFSSIGRKAAGDASKIWSPSIERVKRGPWILFWRKCLGLVLAISISDSLDHFFCVHHLCIDKA